MVSNCNYEGNSEPIKLFDFNGNKNKEINNDNDKTLFIDVYYEELLSNIYIIICCFNYVKSYNYYNNKIYHKYYDNDNEGHLSAIIYFNEVTKLIESCIDGYIRIWNFHTGLLLNKIKLSDKYLYGLCLWDEYQLYVGCGDKTIRLIDLKNELVVKKIILGNKTEVLTIKKFNHSQYGECLICLGLSNDKIKLLINGKNYLNHK